MNRIFAAIARDDVDAIREKVEQHDGATARDSFGRTPLMEAVSTGRNSIVTMLIDVADMNAQDRNGYSALHFAAQSGNVDAARLLLSKGAEVDIEDKFGNTPLGRAVFNSHGAGEMIELLLKHRANPDRTNKSGVSPRQLAESIANYDVKQFFS
jgi:ankyrin repeat protein